MASANDHLIQQQIFDITFEGDKDPYGKPNEVSDYFKNRVMHVLEEILNEHCDANHLMVIDQIHLDLGTIHPLQWKEDFPDKLRKALRAELHKYPKHPLSNISPNNATDIKHTASVADQAPAQAQPAYLTDALLYFLAHGTLPWYINFSLENLLQNITQSKPTPAQLAPLFNVMLHYTEAAQRALQQLPLSLLEQFQQNLFAPASPFIADELAPLVDPNNNLRKKIQLSLLLALFHHNTPKLKNKTQQTFRMTLLQKLLSENEKRELLTQIIEKLPAIKASKYLKKTATLEAGKKKYLLSLLDAETPAVSNDLSATSQSIPEKEPATFIHNAGLVLLHPYLSHFFNICGYTENNHFISDAMHQRAVLSTQLLVQKPEQEENFYPEYHLVLNKILCGYEPHQHLPAQITWTDKEMENAEALLEAVIQNWDALKNISTTALQSSFLQREGKLTENETGANLLVKRQAYDVLVDKLPWAISVIKTPFMKNRLTVNWT